MATHSCVVKTKTTVCLTECGGGGSSSSGGGSSRSSSSSSSPAPLQTKNPLVSHALVGVSRDIVVQQKVGVESTRHHHRDFQLDNDNSVNPSIISKKHHHFNQLPTKTASSWFAYKCIYYFVPLESLSDAGATP